MLTKADLCADAAAACEQTRARFPGAQVVACTAARPDGFDPLRAYLGAGVTAALLGGSGVGKTTLINALAGTALDTQAVRQDGKGRHTTTWRELILLPGGGILIDTPGMRALALEESDVALTFPDLDALAAHCRFSDCTHDKEPGCAVRAALEQGALDARRYRSYRKLLAEERAARQRARAPKKR